MARRFFSGWSATGAIPRATRPSASAPEDPLPRRVVSTLVVSAGLIGGQTVAEFALARLKPCAAMENGDACDIHNKAFQDCINNLSRDISECQVYFERLYHCSRGGHGASYTFA